MYTKFQHPSSKTKYFSIFGLFNALLLASIVGGPLAPREIRTHAPQMSTKNPKCHVIKATFLQ